MIVLVGGALLFLLVLLFGISQWMNGVALRRQLERLEGQVIVDSSTRMTAALQSLQTEQSRLAQALGTTSQSVATVATGAAALQADVRAISAQAQVRAASDAEMREVLRRLEFVIAGVSRRGAAGENILGEVLAALPPGMREEGVRFDNLPVEFVVKLPGGKYLPIDSKWPAADKLARLAEEQDPEARSVLVRSIESDVAAKAEEVAKYLNPDRTLMLGVAALPDAVYNLCSRAHGEAFRKGVVLVPYSLAVPYVLSLLVIVWRFGQALDTGRLQAALSTIESALGELSETLDGHMSRAVTMLGNACDKQRKALSDCLRALDGIRPQT